MERYLYSPIRLHGADRNSVTFLPFLIIRTIIRYFEGTRLRIFFTELLIHTTAIRSVSQPPYFLYDVSVTSETVRWCDAVIYDDSVRIVITLHDTKLGTKLQFTAVGRPVTSNPQISCKSGIQFLTLNMLLQSKFLNNVSCRNQNHTNISPVTS